MATLSAALAIECSSQPLDFAFHPSRPSILAAALVDGTVEVHDIAELDANVLGEVDDDEVDTIVSSTRLFTQGVPSKRVPSGFQQASARCVLFGSDATLYAGGIAGDLVSVHAEDICAFHSTPTKPVQWRISKAHSSPMQVLKMVDENVLVSGDEAGSIRLWDVRLVGGGTPPASSNKLPAGCVHSWKTHDDYISGLEVSADHTTLLASSADCSLSVYDIRSNGRSGSHTNTNNRLLRKSDDQEDELLSIQIMKNGRKVVCGTGEGVLAVWSWGTWGDVSDRFPGHPASVDALLKVDEDTLLTGSSDGLIRVVTLHPDKLLGVLGDHDGFPIEKLQMNADRTLVGSVTHDNIIRLWDARILGEDYEDNEEESKLRAFQPSLAVEETRDSDDAWEDIDSDEEMGEGADSDDCDSDKKPSAKSDKRAGRFKNENEKFFEDL